MSSTPLCDVPKISDAELLAAIRTDLEASPFTGEGHRKVWARLRILRDMRVARARVLRLMRENALLSPYRRAQGEPSAHDGSIQTERPNQMWGTDGIRIETLDEGWVWVFSAVESFRCLLRGHAHGQDRQPLCRLAADCPGAAGRVRHHRRRGRARPGAAHGSRHAIHRRRLPQPGEVLGIAPSFAFVAEPQTNGVAERFNRTLKEQAIYGRVFKNVEEVRVAVTEFRDRYNRHWRLEQLGFMSPL